ncbi:MAG: Large-conductance mechanosensitive channel [Parcubacteria group bacterium GW2011_GWA2_43_11]|nr:MAG: Large-conductance mechanosensitive channel [Parcubacteria group bacterium GW2011_GWC2_42_11]KKS86089.1 MAG: Large-conductance mechanosensitive channel [Parcubacteria group bacterium GW2011_GWA2_43_11]
MKKFLEEFKQFAMRGNVVDLAIAVVVGGAFGKIVTSLTNDIIMPVIGYITGGIDFGDLRWTLKESVNDAPAVTVQYGFFINSIITFLIVAFVIFIVMKAMNEIQRQKDLVLAKTLKKAQKEEEKIEEAKLSKQEELLTEIRDLLSKK